MRKSRLKNLILTLTLALPLILSSVTGFVQAQAKDMNIQDSGSLTIHKLLNPNYREPDEVGSGNEFQGDGTATGTNANGGLAISGQPLAGVEFTIVGRLTDAQVRQLEDSNGKVSQANAEDFLANLPAGMEERTGVTGADGTITFSGLPVNTDELDNNRWLVVETGKPDTVDKAAAPVIVNVPTGTPETSTNNYNYDVHLYVKNYSSGEPEIEKEIDKPTHSTGDRVQYTLKITDLPDDLVNYERLEVYDPLDERLSLLGEAPHTESLGKVTLKSADGTVKKEFTPYITADTSVTAENTPAGYDVLIRTGETKAEETGKGQYIYWGMTAEGIAKLTDLEQGDYIELPFEAMVNDKANPNEAIPNDGELGFENKPGHNGTKPVDPENPNTPGPEDPNYGPGKPTEVVNTIFGKKDFLKTDADTNVPLQGAEFIVKDTPKQPINTVDAAGNPIVLPADREIYAVVENGRVVRWTADKNEATPITSGADGKFSVDGLAYTNEVNFSKQYIFAVKGPLLTGDGSVYQPETIVTREYVSIEAKPRTSSTTQVQIDAEIQAILDEHADWVFYKESETNPAQIDYLGNQIHEYALEETKAPNGYVPLKNDIPFTVPGDETEINIPNKKTPGIPITGGMGTIIFLVIGVLLMGGAYKLRKGKEA